jgi:protein-tyrosine-phosphatase
MSQATNPKQIFFVCVSNTCRSPMAEYLFRRYLQQQGIESEFTVASRSLTTMYEPENSPASYQGVEVMEKYYGVDMTGHRSKLLSAEDVQNAYAIIPVKRGLRDDIIHYFPESKDKFIHFQEDIEDPWHQPVSVFKSCAAMMEKQFPTIFNQLTNYRYK